MKKRYAPAALLTAALILSILSGCTSAPKEASIQTIAMDTFITLTAYGSDQGDCQEALEAAAEELRSLDRQLAATDEGSLIYALNHAGGSWVELDGETSAMLEETLALCGLTGGALDITAYPAVQAWGFISGDYRVPGPDELDQLSDLIDYTRLELEGTQIRLPDGMEVELGAVAKGYAGDRLAALLAERGIATVVQLHRETVARVKAPAQARAAAVILPLLTEAEHDVYRRGRNSHVNTVPHGATPGQYHAATALEAVFGWLWLRGERERIHELFAHITEDYDAA